jgi:tetratricopeptide (TPR) repeat protein
MGEAYWMRYDRTKEKLSRDAAENDVRRALRMSPKLAEARLAQAHGYLTVGKAEDAKTVLLALVHDKPKMSQGWALLGRAHQATGDKEKGLAALQRAIALDPNNWRPYVQLGQFYKRTQDYAAAERSFHQALARKQTSPTAWMNLGGVLLLQGKTLEALTALETGTRYDPAPGTYSNLGSTYYYSGDYAKAADRYRQAAELDPLNPTYPGNLGDACRMLGERTEADSAYREAARLAVAVLANAPDDIPLRVQLALASARLGDADSARLEAQRILRSDPHNVDALFALAVNSAVQGDDDAATDDLERAVHLGLGKAQIVNDPDLARLKGQPRFERVLKIAS